MATEYEMTAYTTENIPNTIYFVAPKGTPKSAMSVAEHCIDMSIELGLTYLIDGAFQNEARSRLTAFMYGFVQSRFGLPKIWVYVFSEDEDAPYAEELRHYLDCTMVTGYDERAVRCLAYTVPDAVKGLLPFEPVIGPFMGDSEDVPMSSLH